MAAGDPLDILLAAGTDHAEQIYELRDEYRCWPRLQQEFNRAELLSMSAV